MFFKVIDLESGDEVDVNILEKEEWFNKGIYRDKDGEIIYSTAPLISFYGFALDDGGFLIILDTCGNYAYPPIGRFKVILTDDVENWINQNI